MIHSRRNFFFLAAGGLLLGEDRAKRDMIVRAARPEDLEMPLSGFTDYITPIEHFFVRTHVYVPDVNLNDWRLKVEGEVATPLTFTMDDLKKLPAVELVSVVECAGNGRGLYEPSVPGLQWVNGSVGNGRWRGVRLADLLKKAGIKSSAVEVLFDGADEPIGTMQDFRRSITTKKALDPNTLLAYEMNGETLPVKHGFPLRVVAPGWASDSWVKWLTSIQVLDKEWDGFWMKNAYRHPGKPVAPGTAVPPEQMKPVTSLRVKSVIASPVDGGQVLVGKAVTIQGVAWSGDAGPVSSVDVSVDGGRNWSPARLGRDKSQFGWRQWELPWTPQRDEYYTIMARARDSSGATQPFAQEWNPSGYGWNVAPRVGVDARTTLAETPSPAPVSPSQSPAAYKTACLTCHEEDVIRQQRLTRAQWDREITKMTGWGAQVKQEDRESFLNYLVANFGPRPRAR
jgi:DMSO/TMAO reductase YedYZ molybdopterin-dependent catalytic subunit